MTIEEYDTYFLDIAKKLKAISHTDAHPRFASFQIDEVLSGLRTNLDVNDYFMLKEDMEGTLPRVSDEHFHNLQSGAVMILRSCPVDDFAQERVIKARAFELCMEVAAKMVQDKRNAILSGSESLVFLRYLDERGFAYQPVGSIFDNCHGYRLEFRFKESIKLLVDNDEWND